ncbi:MAG: sigma-70 family RNA polymerase sigma factor, partial [Candidatus Omnitrophica bacterium]|nr:sigma-70 family RNA polymerase sigma factor [Candidatus Omnitrophota bacterium]
MTSIEDEYAQTQKPRSLYVLKRIIHSYLEHHYPRKLFGAIDTMHAAVNDIAIWPIVENPWMNSTFLSWLATDKQRGPPIAYLDAQKLSIAQILEMLRNSPEQPSPAVQVPSLAGHQFILPYLKACFPVNIKKIAKYNNFSPVRVLVRINRSTVELEIIEGSLEYEQQRTLLRRLSQALERELPYAPAKEFILEITADMPQIFGDFRVMLANTIIPPDGMCTIRVYPLVLEDPETLYKYLGYLSIDQEIIDSRITPIQRKTEVFSQQDAENLMQSMLVDELMHVSSRNICHNALLQVVSSNPELSKSLRKILVFDKKSFSCYYCSALAESWFSNWLYWPCVCGPWQRVENGKIEFQYDGLHAGISLQVPYNLEWMQASLETIALRNPQNKRVLSIGGFGHDEFSIFNEAMFEGEHTGIITLPNGRKQQGRRCIFALPFEHLVNYPQLKSFFAHGKDIVWGFFSTLIIDEQRKLLPYTQTAKPLLLSENGNETEVVIFKEGVKPAKFYVIDSKEQKVSKAIPLVFAFHIDTGSYFKIYLSRGAIEFFEYEEHFKPEQFPAFLRAIAACEYAISQGKTYAQAIEEQEKVEGYLGIRKTLAHLQICFVRLTDEQEKLYLSNKRLVRYRVKKFCGIPGFDYEDLTSIGLRGLKKAVLKFVEGRGTTFASYAIPIIDGEIRNDLRDQDFRPRALKEGSFAYHSTVERLWNSLGRKPTTKEIAINMNTSEDKIREIQVGNQAVKMLSLEAPAFGDDTGATFTDTLIIGNGDDFSAAQAEAALITRVMNRLTEQQRQVLELTYVDEITQIAMIPILGLPNQMAVSRLLAKARDRFMELYAKYSREKSTAASMKAITSNELYRIARTFEGVMDEAARKLKAIADSLKIIEERLGVSEQPVAYYDLKDKKICYSDGICNEHGLSKEILYDILRAKVSDPEVIWKTIHFIPRHEALHQEYPQLDEESIILLQVLLDEANEFVFAEFKNKSDKPLWAFHEVILHAHLGREATVELLLRMKPCLLRILDKDDIPPEIKADVIEALIALVYYDSSLAIEALRERLSVFNEYIEDVELAPRLRGAALGALSELAFYNDQQAFGLIEERAARFCQEIITENAETVWQLEVLASWKIAVSCNSQLVIDLIKAQSDGLRLLAERVNYNKTIQRLVSELLCTAAYYQPLPLIAQMDPVLFEETLKPFVDAGDKSAAKAIAEAMRSPMVNKDVKNTLRAYVLNAVNVDHDLLKGLMPAAEAIIRRDFGDRNRQSAQGDLLKALFEFLTGHHPRRAIAAIERLSPAIMRKIDEVYLSQGAGKPGLGDLANLTPGFDIVSDDGRPVGGAFILSGEVLADPWLLYGAAIGLLATTAAFGSREVIANIEVYLSDFTGMIIEPPHKNENVRHLSLLAVLSAAFWGSQKAIEALRSPAIFDRIKCCFDQEVLARVISIGSLAELALNGYKPAIDFIDARSIDLFSVAVDKDANHNLQAMVFSALGAAAGQNSAAATQALVRLRQDMEGFIRSRQVEPRYKLMAFAALSAPQAVESTGYPDLAQLIQERRKLLEKFISTTTVRHHLTLTAVRTLANAASMGIEPAIDILNAKQVDLQGIYDNE